ncbi:SURF1 family protein [Nocardioides cavernae]|uniref:SURF1-like protein n=1 Tax=Nocardioides cavernae TaxID=1921566 RepID=A0ABR8N7A2_9ACTN|nr:SURF1 family protein [Nocardioides cavernae]MBD3924012.1 SURF1 family protein [Nocardioides cavernae]MBM7511050.1 cytochrome oxidase assembly protein ShyY1 [Nocardioides cavernae]
MTAPRRPGLLTDLGAAALALVLVGIAGMLGKWQYDAWQAHRDAEARDLTGITPVPLDDVMGNDDPFPAPDLGRPVEVAGEWLDGGFWVADRSRAGEPGYWAVTPLQTGDAAVLVVRGWAPEPDADLLAASGEAEVTGWLQPPEGTLVVDDDPTDDVFPEIRVADAVQRVDVDLWSAYVISQDPGPGLEEAELAALPTPSRTTGVRNLLYAVEWWVFGAFAAFIWWRWRRDATRPDLAPDLPSPSAG